MFITGEVMHYKNSNLDIEVLDYLVAVSLPSLRFTVLHVWIQSGSTANVQFNAPAMRYQHTLLLPIEAGILSYNLVTRNYSITSTQQGGLTGYIATPTIATSSSDGNAARVFVAQQGFVSTYFAALPAKNVGASTQYTRFLNGVCDITNSALPLNDTWVLFACTAWGIGASGGQLVVMDFSSYPVVFQEQLLTQLTLDSKNVVQVGNALFFASTSKDGGITKVLL
jgi:hypothetical protein